MAVVATEHHPRAGGAALPPRRGVAGRDDLSGTRVQRRDAVLRGRGSVGQGRGPVPRLPGQHVPPERPHHRGQYIRSLYNFAGPQDVTGFVEHDFLDVTPFYDDAVTWAAAWGLANGFPELTFRQTQSIKRGNAARTFYNTAQTPMAWDDPMTAPTTMIFRSDILP